MPSSWDIDVIIHVLESQEVERGQVADNLVSLLLLCTAFALSTSVKFTPHLIHWHITKIMVVFSFLSLSFLLQK